MQENFSRKMNERSFSKRNKTASLVFIENYRKI